jgi:hypothetical protein
MHLGAAFNELWALRQQGTWTPGDNLALIPDLESVPPGVSLFALFARAAAEGLTSFNTLGGADRERWGAVMMVAGALAFKRCGSKVKTYATIGESIGFGGLEREMRAERLDAMEEGAKRWLGIRILQNGLGRCFRETMLAHSGLDMEILALCADLVAANWSWDAVVRSSLADVEAFLAPRMNMPLRTAYRAQLQQPEFLPAVCALLIELARFRRDVLERGLARPTITDTRVALDAAGISAKPLLGAEPSDNLLDALFDFRQARPDQDVSSPRWFWSTYEGAYGLAVVIPRQVAFNSVPICVDRVRLVAVDSAGHPLGAADGFDFLRSGSVFRRVAGASRLLLRPGTRLPIQLVLRYCSGPEEVECVFSSLDLPREPVTMFDPGSGEPTRSAPVGSPVILAVAPGWTLRDPPAGINAVSGSALPAFRGSVPAPSLDLRFETLDGESVIWPFGQGEPVRLLPRGLAVEGLRFKGSPAFNRWPEIRVDGIEILAGRGEARIESLGPVGGSGLRHTHVIETVRVRNGRLEAPSVQPEPGEYRVRLEAGERPAITRFVLLPKDARFTTQNEEPDSTGLVASRASVKGLNADLRVCDSPEGETIAEGVIRFPAGATGPRTLSVATREMELTWKLCLHPPCARILVSEGNALQLPWDLSACNPASVLEVFGEPGEEIQVRALGKVLRRRLGPEGRREICMLELPSPLFDRATERIDIRWENGARREFALVNQQLAKPRFRRRSDDDPRLLLQASRPIRGPVLAELVLAWAPWEPAESQPVQEVQEGGKSWFEVSLPPSPGPYMVALTERNRPVTGMVLAEVPGSRQDLKNPLSNLLWGRTSTIQSMVEVLRAQPPDLAERIAERVERYGWSYFRVSGALPSVAGRSFLYRLAASPGSAEDCALGRLLRRNGYDLMVARYSDLDEVTAALTADEDRLVEALDALAVRAVGLLFAAGRRWMPRSPEATARWGEIMSTVAHLQSGRPWRLKARDSELLKTPSTSSENPINPRPEDLCAGLSPRLTGLMQARAWRGALSDDPALRDIVRRYGGDAGPVRDPDFRRVIEVDEARVPEETVRHEAAVFACTREVHRWRSGKGSPEACKDARELAQHVATLVDYWLNYWASKTQL